MEQKGDTFRFTMYEKAKVHVERIPELLDTYKGELEFKVETNPYFVYRKKGKNKKDKDDDVLSTVKNVLNGIKTLLD